MKNRIKDLAVKALYSRPKFEYGRTSSKKDTPVGTSPGEVLRSARGYADGGSPENPNTPTKPWDAWAPTNYKSWDDVPIINPQELVGKRIGSLEADLTRAGGQYTGIDQSKIDNPEPMLGGPSYPLMEESQKNKLGWAVQGKGKGTQKLNKDFDYIAVHAMKGDAHRSNTSIVNSVLGTMKAYMRDKRITPEGLETLKQIISKPSDDKELKELENFPGFDSPDLDKYIHSIGFKPRSALVDRLWSAAAEKTGSPQVAKILRDTLDKNWAGVPLGHAMYLLEIPKGSSDALVHLQQAGLPIHPSYDWGIHGRIVGRFAHPAAREILHEPWFKEKREEHKEKIAQGKKVDINAAFRRALPVTTITQDIADRLPHAPKDIQSAKAAQLALNAFNDNWDTTETPVTKGGLGAASLAQALRDSDSSSTLTPYDPKELQKMVRSGKFTGYKLKNGEVYFGLKRGTNYADEYGFEHPDLTPNETALVSVVNNEPGAKGIGGAPVVLKAIQHGATALDAFAVPSKKHPNGFLPDFYSHFGFEELGRIPFNPDFFTPQHIEDMKHEWTKAGWDESMGMPPLAIMKWRGSDKDRENAVRKFIAEGGGGFGPRRGSEDVEAAARASEQGAGSPVGAPQGRRGRGDTGGDRGTVRTDNVSRPTDRLTRTLAALKGLSPSELEHFGIDPAQLEQAKKLGLKRGGAVDDDFDDYDDTEEYHGGWHDYADGGVVSDYNPQKTVKAYKLFRVKKKDPGKLFPLFVRANEEVPMGQWVEAKAGDPGKDPSKVKSSLGDLAYRPGWHAGDLPLATHIGGRSHKDKKLPPDTRSPNHVWAEVEMPADVDWQSVADSRMEYTKDGRPKVSTAHITDQVPFHGFYRYKTNPAMTGNWLIGGHMRVNRILSDDEVNDINSSAGVEDLPRREPSYASTMDWTKKAGGGFVSLHPAMRIPGVHIRTAEAGEPIFHRGE